MQSHNQTALKSHFKPVFLWLRALTAAMKEERAALSPLFHWMKETILWRCICSLGRMLGSRQVWVTWQSREISHFPVFSNVSVCLEVKHLWPDLRGGRNKGQAVDHYPMRGSKCGRICFPLYHGLLAKPTVLWWCRMFALHFLQVTL